MWRVSGKTDPRIGHRNGVRSLFLLSEVLERGEGHGFVCLKGQPMSAGGVRILG